MILREGLGWLSILILLVGGLVCAVYLTRVRWAAVLMGGFGLQVVWMGFSRLVTIMMRHGMYGGTRAVLAFAALAGLLGSILLVVGAIGLLAEHARMLRERQGQG